MRARLVTSLFPGWRPLSERERVDFTGSPIERFTKLRNAERRAIYRQSYSEHDRKVSPRPDLTSDRGRDCSSGRFSGRVAGNSREQMAYVV